MLVTTVPQQLCRQTDTANLQLGKHNPISTRPNRTTTATRRRERKRRCRDKHQGFYPVEGNPDHNDQDECDPNRNDSGKQGAEHGQSDRQNADPEFKQCNPAYHQTDQPSNPCLFLDARELACISQTCTHSHYLVSEYTPLVQFGTGWDSNDDDVTAHPAATDDIAATAAAAAHPDDGVSEHDDNEYSSEDAFIINEEPDSEWVFQLELDAMRQRCCRRLDTEPHLPPQCKKLLEPILDRCGTAWEMDEDDCTELLCELHEALDDISSMVGPDFLDMNSIFSAA